MYTVTEKELISIIETLKEFRDIFLVQQLRRYTDHKKLPVNNLTPIKNQDVDLYLKIIFCRQNIQGNNKQYHMHNNNYPIMVLKILQRRLITQQELCQKTMTSMNYLKICFLYILRRLSDINVNTPD